MKKVARFKVRYHSQEGYPVETIYCDAVHYTNKKYLVCKKRYFIFSKTIALIPHEYVYDVR